MARKYDIIIFGASGFTGQYTVEEMGRVWQENDSLSWAIAGRSQQRLEQTLFTASKITGIESLLTIPIIIADVSDVKSLDSMSKQAQIIMNCVGPFCFVGEPVVKACVENGTHHIDISGEPQFLENMQLKYHKEALKNKAYIVGACGWGSIASEMGIKFTQESASGPLNSVEAFITLIVEGCSHSATWKSIMHSFAQRGELVNIRKQLYLTRLPEPKHRLPRRSVLSFCDETRTWGIPFPGSDRSVVMGSQRHLFELGKQQRFLQFIPYLQLPTIFRACVMLLFGIFFGFMCRFRATRNLMERFPSVFTQGRFTFSGPSREQVAASSFSMHFVGLGWRDSSTVDLEPPNVKTVTCITGPSAGYVATPICHVQSALCILQERSKLPLEGGVFTPGAAFHNTSLIERLSKAGIEFSKLYEADTSD